MKRQLLIFLILLAACTAMAQSHVSDLVVIPISGGTIKWYNAANAGTEYTNPSTTVLVSGQKYYASQTVNGVESTARFEVTATVNPVPTPIFTAQPGATATVGTDVTYTTQSGKSSYVWTFPGTVTTDYSITSGGTSTDYTVTLKYVSSGSKTVTINYTANGCTAASATSSIATSVSTPLAIGTAYRGGRIAYFFQSGEPGYVEGETHGLIAALADLAGSWSTTVVQCYGSGDALASCWAASIYTNANAATSQTASLALGMGQANTTAIIARHDAGLVSKADYAAGICDNYTNADNGTGVYSDWYIPSRDELNKLRINQAVIGNFYGIADYWSSSEESAGGALRMSFLNGDCLGVGKGNHIRFRPVRNF